MRPERLGCSSQSTAGRPPSAVTALLAGRRGHHGEGRASPREGHGITVGAARFMGRPCVLWGGRAFYGKSRAFYGKSRAFYGKSRAFYGKSRAFAMKGLVFYGESRAFYGEEHSFLRDGC